LIWQRKKQLNSPSGRLSFAPPGATHGASEASRFLSLPVRRTPHEEMICHQELLVSADSRRVPITA
jgi:hypothetical protein